MENKKSFLVYVSSRVLFEMLSPENCKELILAIFDYNIDGRLLESESDVVKMAFEVMKQYMDENNERYEARCRVNKENGKKGGAPRGNSNARKKRSTKTPQVASEENPENPPEIEYSEEQIKRCNKVANMFNEICGESYEWVERLSITRIKGILQMLDGIAQKCPNEKKVNVLDSIFTKMQRSDYLAGRRKNADWRASFNWMLQGDNWLKILEGEYD
ncbi:MAG: hypothetical protein IIV65_08780 [Alistipes sp.]|nr:hypothetical protein [Alistipes sp.]